MADFTMNQNPSVKKKKSSMANPVLRRMEKKSAVNPDNCATYKGIAGKTIYFLLATVIGYLLIGIVHNLASGGAIHFADTENGIYDITTSTPEMILVVIAAAVSIIVPFLTWFAKKTIPVVGTIYCLAQGIFIGFITLALASQYRWASFLAVVITFAIVAVMLFVYAKRIITVTKRFRGIISIVFGTIVIGGILVFLLNLIPGVRSMMSGINQVLESPVFGVVLSVIFVIIAALFLLADFDTIERCVQNKMDKSFEWMAAWGLAYTILYLYFKILRIILMILGNSKSSSK